jgi:thiol:disulfide interchange protein DsbC
MRISLAILSCLGTALALPASFAGDAKPDDATTNATANTTAAGEQADPRVELAKKLKSKPENLRPSPIEGVYEFSQGADVGYVTSDGRYFFSGDLYEVQSRTNLSDVRRSEMRRQILAGIPESEMMIFGSSSAKYTITVFTDVDCGFCRQLHSHIREINNLGVRVRYLFYPRSGPGSDSWKTAEAVWCSADRNDALTRAKLGEQIKAKNCGPTPVKREWELGKDRSRRRRYARDLHEQRRLPVGLLAARAAPRKNQDGDEIDRHPEEGRSIPVSGPQKVLRLQTLRGDSQRSSSFSLSGLPSHSLASAGAAFFSVITGHWRDRSAFNALNCS